MTYKIEPIRNFSYPARLPSGKVINFKSLEKRGVFLTLWNNCRDFSNENVENIIAQAKSA